MKYDIIPKQFLAENREAVSADEAVIAFATEMDSNMNNYFKAVPHDDTPSEIAKQIEALIKCTQLSADDCGAIFMALRNQDEVLGGKIWTRSDIERQLREDYGDCVDQIPEEWVDEVQNNVDDRILSDCDDSEESCLKSAIKNAELCVKATDIEWDTDGDDVDLPNEVTIPLSELDHGYDIADWLSDNYEFCVVSYDIELVKEVA